MRLRHLQHLYYGDNIFNEFLIATSRDFSAELRNIPRMFIHEKKMARP